MQYMHGALNLSAIASEREFMVLVVVLVGAATFLATGAIAAWMSLVGPQEKVSSRYGVVRLLG